MKRLTRAALVAALAAGCGAEAQTPPGTAGAPPVPAAPAAAPAAAWKPFDEFRGLVGTWSGTADWNKRIGGRVARFGVEMGGNFLVHRGSTIFSASEGLAEEATEEYGIYAYDRVKRKYVAHYFYSTGVYGVYDVEFGADGTVRLQSTQLSNYEDGARARMTFQKTGDTQLSAAFDLAAAGQAFQPFLTSKLTKK